MQIEAFFEERTSTVTYVAFDAEAGVCVVIDPVLDFDAASGRRSTASADAVARFIDSKNLRVPYVLDTHAHADHVSALPYFKERFGAETVIGEKIVEVQRFFCELFHLDEGIGVTSQPFDRLLSGGESLDVGAFSIEAIHTPGHTPACLTYRIEDALFVGDTLFQPDYGTARCDFPGGSAGELYDSIQRLYASFPPETRVFTCHDYRPGGRKLAFESTLEEQRTNNVQLKAATPRADFIAFRKQRDASLSVPALILPAMQVNIRAGVFPAPEANGVSYLKIPLDKLGANRD